MATIPTLPVETSVELLGSIQAIVDADPQLSPIDDAGVKTCLHNLAMALQITVASITTMKSSIISETGTANVAFKNLEASMVELRAKTSDMAASLSSGFTSPKPFVTRICETKSIANLKPFGDDRTGFRLWHDKLINAISQHVTGSRALFTEMRSQLTANKNGLTLTEWKLMWNAFVTNAGHAFDKDMTFDKFNEDLYCILTEKPKAMQQPELGQSNQAKGSKHTSVFTSGSQAHVAWR